MTGAVTAAVRGMRPPPRYDPASWAAARRVLTSAETGTPGRWRNERAPFAVEPMQHLALHDTTSRVVLMFAAQVVKSEVCNNLIGYLADWVPCPVMMLRPTIDDCEGYSKQRLKHLFASPALAGKVKEPRSRDSGNTLMLKEFPGGLLVLAGANAPSRLASWPIRVLIADEVDRFPESAGTEGDPLALARARLTSFGDRSKELDTSTPTVTGKSRIEAEYLASSRGVYHVPCPLCGELQSLKWPNLKWDLDDNGRPSRVWYECDACHGEVDEHHKTAMLAAGGWIHADPDNPVKGYHLNALYAPVGSIAWPMLVQEWLTATARAKSGDPHLLQVFVNTRLAETWEDRGQQVDLTTLANRAEVWDAVPAGVQVITTFTDTQDDRLETETVGWGRGNERWSLAYHVIPIDPIDKEAWKRNDEILWRQYRTEDGRTLQAAASLVDSGGHRTQQVYEYCQARRNRRVYAVKGMPGNRPIWDKRLSRGGRKGDMRFHLVGTDAVSDAAYAYLKVTEPGPGYCHFPAGRTTTIPDYFDQLASMKRVRKVDARGFVRGEWHKKVEGRRNEAWACFVGNLAALHSLFVSGLRFDDGPAPAAKPKPAPQPHPVLTTTGTAPDRESGTAPRRQATPRGWNKPGPKRGGW